MSIDAGISITDFGLWLGRWELYRYREVLTPGIMSVSRELRERFAKSEEKDTTPLPEQVSVSRELRERFAQPEEIDLSPIVTEALGIASEDLEAVIVGDIAAMIEKGYRPALEGYIFCLSRILDHAKGWTYINRAFNDRNEKVPERYHRQFGQHLPDKIRKKGPVVT